MGCRFDKNMVKKPPTTKESITQTNLMWVLQPSEPKKEVDLDILGYL